MKLVVDSNIIFSALISPNGKTADLIFNKEIELFSSRTLEKEIINHKVEIIKKSGLSEADFELLCEVLLDGICFVENEELREPLKQAKDFCPDEDDESFFAVSLAKDIPLWSNDKILKQQKIVKVINTEELVKRLSGVKF